MNLLVLVFLLYMKICLISCEAECRSFETCGGCIGFAHDKCVWCPAEDHIGRRCQSKKSQTGVCRDVYDPNKTEIVDTVDKDFNEGKSGSTIQFKPQSMKIKVRTQAPFTFKMSYKPAKDYPLDIYYLMDFSSTMSNYSKELHDQGNKIYEELTKITNNVNLGIGSFVEKPDFPYVDPSTQISYSFRHHLSLTDNMTKFAEVLKTHTPIGSNNDEPEADLDALMQAMVCKDEVGWRDESNRIILLSTDSTYHSAGDGKFVGAIRPHDMKCHLKNNEYSMALTLDYPSVSQINKVASDKKIIIIFAVKQVVQRDYQVLEQKIQNAKYVPLTENSGVVDMIVNEYRKLVDSVQLGVKVPNFMSLNFSPDCTTLQTEEEKCAYKDKKPVEILGTLTVNSCPTDGKQMHSVEIGPVSLDDKLIINVETICQCDCEKPGVGEINSERCSKSGTYQCGICKCNNNSHGNTCNCTGTSTNLLDLDKCKANESDATYCSGHGTCSCGKCVDCHKGFSGDFCEFDDNSCERPGGLLCSGHGNCTLGRCECEQHWLPKDCRCPDSNQTCIAPHSKELCSGSGVCECGRCNCYRNTSTNEYCSGRFCDECEEFAAKRCKELENYAYCNFNENKLDCDQKFNFTDTNITLVSKTEIYSPNWYMAKMWCRKVLEDERILVFKYHYPPSTSTLLLIIQNELDMPPVADVWIAVGSVIGAVLLIGILTIIAWKVLVDLHDKREYDKFAKDSAAAGYDVSLNPLYQSPATSFSNPAYRG